MLDTGAQLNLIHADMLPHLLFTTTTLAPIAFTGIGRQTSSTCRWVTIELTFENGSQYVCCFATTTACAPNLILLGMPFFLQSEGSINFKDLLFESHNCSLPIVTSHHSLTILAVMLNTDISSKLKHLPPEFQNPLAATLQKYQSLWQDKKRGCVQTISHEIILLHQRPIVSRPRYRTEAQAEVINAEITQMLNDGVIRPSGSPYASEIVMIQKKSLEWRMCIDFRPLNLATVPDKYPLPRMVDLLRCVADSRYFIAIDLRSGYWQIPMHDNSISLTAFRSPTGLYEFVVMPFGLRNAPATFQRSMNYLLEDLRFEGVLVYLDDVLIHSSDFRHLIHLLNTVFDRFSKAGYTINLGKCQFLAERLLYLGHVIEAGRICPSPDKIEAITLLKPPSTVTEVRSLLGLTGFVQSFIPHYSTICAPITDLLKGAPKKKGSKFKVDWTKSCQKALDQLKQIIKTSVLNQTLDGDEYKLECDASSWAISGVLSVKRNGLFYPVHYISKKLDDSQVRWHIREKEAYAIVYSLQKLDYHLKGRHVDVYTDHQNLRGLLAASKGKLSTWAILLAEYDITIYYHKGEDNFVADYISRKVYDPVDVEDYMVYTAKADFPNFTLNEILSAQDPKKTHLTNGFHLVDNVIYYRSGIFVPVPWRYRIIGDAHSRPPILHPGIKKTKSLIMKCFNWPALHQDVTEYVGSCLTCQRIRALPFTKKAFAPHDPHLGALSVLHVDFWSANYRGQPFTLLTMIDSFTRWAEVTLVEDKRSETVASSLLTHWISRFGCPSRLISDNDLSFSSAVIDLLATQLRYKHIHTIPYRPQGNALIEVFHKNLNKWFQYQLTNHIKVSLTEAIAMAMMAYRSTFHGSLGMSPAYALYGRDPVSPVPSDWRFAKDGSMGRLKILNELRWNNLAHLRSVQLQTKIETPVQFEVGDLVLCPRNPHEIYREAVLTETSEKLVTKWTLPKRVIGISSNGFRIHVRNLLDWTESTYTKDQVRRIVIPLTEDRIEEWHRHIEDELASIDTPKAKIKRYLEELHKPQAKFCRFDTSSAAH